MPINLPYEGLPAVEALQQENIFVMTPSRARTQDIRPLRIALVNLMPHKSVTETQLIRMLGSTPLQIELTLLATASYRPTHTDRAYLHAFYRTLESVRSEYFDGLIVTGAPIETMPFESVAYWQELCALFDWARQHVFSAFFICWGAQAALYHYYGIDKLPLGRKMFGVFPHRVLNPRHELVRGFDEVFYAPHSRHTAVPVEAVACHPALEVLAVSEEAGLYLAASRDGRQVFVTGHSEYDRDTLDGEYRRDLAAGRAIERPVHYYPNDDPAGVPAVCWRAHGQLLYQNWLNYCVYQRTPYDLRELAQKPRRDATA